MGVNSDKVMARRREEWPTFREGFYDSYSDWYTYGYTEGMMGYALYETLGSTNKICSKAHADGWRDGSGTRRLVEELEIIKFQEQIGWPVYE